MTLTEAYEALIGLHGQECAIRQMKGNDTFKGGIGIDCGEISKGSNTSITSDTRCLQSALSGFEQTGFFEC